MCIRITFVSLSLNSGCFLQVKCYKMMKIFCYLILVHYTLIIGGQEFRSDYKYHPKIGSWLKFHDIPLPFQDAQMKCYYEGALLASPTEELKSSLMEIVKLNNIPSQKVLTGIHATFSKGEFQSIEGVPLFYIPHKWSEDEPTHVDNRNCLTMNQFGTLGFVDCADPYQYICYRKHRNMKLTKCGTVDTGYVMDNRTGSCYKYHRTPHTWEKAFGICAAEGAHLAIINSEVEAQVIKEIIERNPPSSISPSVNPADGGFLGFRDLTQQGDWYTIHGQTLAEAGFDKFGAGQPDNYGNSQYCGQMWRTGFLDDMYCDSKIPFTCEKRVNTLVTGGQMANYLPSDDILNIMNTSEVEIV